MAQIATKFVQWDVPELATLQGSRVYKLREHLNNGGKLNREDKNWITRNVSGKSSVSCPLKPSDSAPLKHSTMPP